MVDTHNASIRPGFQRVVALLGGQPAPGAGSGEWSEIFAIAQQERVLPLVLAAAQSQREEIPEAAELQRELAISTFWWSSELKGILRGFAEDNVDVVLLKGPSLAERLYGGANQRECRDLDLLVRPSDLDAAESLLASLKFFPDGRPDDYHRGWRRGTTMVELHVDVENPLAIDFDIASAWLRTLPHRFAGEPCRILAPADELLFLCLHGVRHRYERLSLVVDVARGLSRLGPAIGPAAFRSGAPARLKHLVFLGAAMVRRIDPALVLPAGLDLDEQYRAQMESIAAALWQELEQGSAIPLDWRRQHEFYLQLEPGPSQRLAARLRLARILATRLIAEDFAFALRFGVRQPAAVWVMRQVRLIGRMVRRVSRHKVQ